MHYVLSTCVVARKLSGIGRQPVQIHVMTYISGVNWDSAWDSKQQGSYGSVPVFFIGRDALVANKQAAGRAKDLADVEALRPPQNASEGLNATQNASPSSTATPIRVTVFRRPNGPQTTTGSCNSISHCGSLITTRDK